MRDRSSVRRRRWCTKIDVDDGHGKALKQLRAIAGGDVWDKL